MPAMGSDEPGISTHDHLPFWMAASIVALGVVVVVALLVVPAPATTVVGSGPAAAAPINSDPGLTTFRGNASRS